MSKITVIIPVFKIESYLERCVCSILAQTFSDFDVILVDDGSPDRSPEICDAYAAADPRVHVIHQANGGPSKARNAGIDWAFRYSDSEYLAFVDGDDCVHPQYLEFLYAAVQEQGVPVAMCGHRYFYSQELTEAFAEPVGYSSCKMSAEALMVSHNETFNYAWGKLFAKPCFAQLRYPEDVSFGEDNMVIYQAVFSGAEAAWVELPLYFYFHNPAGITKTPWSTRSLDVFTGIREQLDYYRKHGYEKAFRKETELYIQQCAYQVHRIREDKGNRQKNEPHLQMLVKQMRQLLRENPQYRLENYPYWDEALHPVRTSAGKLLHRIKHNVQENGIGKTVQKVLKKYL
jgi:glycosyltransferase involved in cell wall biosynthesis